MKITALFTTLLIAATATPLAAHAGGPGRCLRPHRCGVRNGGGFEPGLRMAPWHGCAQAHDDRVLQTRNRVAGTFDACLEPIVDQAGLGYRGPDSRGKGRRVRNEEA